MQIIKGKQKTKQKKRKVKGKGTWVSRVLIALSLSLSDLPRSLPLRWGSVDRGNECPTIYARIAAPCFNLHSFLC